MLSKVIIIGVIFAVIDSVQTHDLFALLTSSDKLSLVFACCVVFMFHFSILIFEELLLRGSTGFNLTAVEDCIFADSRSEAIRDELSYGVNKEDC